MNVSNSMFGGSAAALGLGSGNSGVHAKLSRERKHRMRELATQKLSQAYYLDEIAASVATMQGASSLEEVAKFVLQRQADDCDAKYVHFFHEKIPSRMMAQCTDLKLLDEIIRKRPLDGAPLRTRAMTRLFKDDYDGALQDLSDAIRIHRRTSGPHSKGKPATLRLDQAAFESPHERTVPARQNEDLPIDSERPSGLEAQLLFHRAGVYLAIACLNIQHALPSHCLDRQRDESNSNSTQLEAQKNVKANAKRALRDYLMYLSHYEYTPGLTTDAAAELIENMKSLTYDMPEPHRSYPFSSPETSVNGSHGNSNRTQQLMHYQNRESSNHQTNTSPQPTNRSSFIPPKVYPICDLFSPSPLPDIPPYPLQGKALVTLKAGSQQRQQDVLSRQMQAYVDCHEALSYHPLLTDALHSLLLCHALLQTPTRELVRHAYMVARLTRICDGYPVFLAARSPSRSDWIHIHQRTNNWLGLSQTWEQLCKPAALPGKADLHDEHENPEQLRERRRHEAIVEALADERVHDAASFQAAVDAREPETPSVNGTGTPTANIEAKRSMHGDSRDCSIGTERAEAIALWIQEAPDLVSVGSHTKRGTKNKARRANKNNVEVVHEP